MKSGEFIFFIIMLWLNNCQNRVLCFASKIPCNFCNKLNQDQLLHSYNKSFKNGINKVCVGFGNSLPPVNGT